MFLRFPSPVYRTFERYLGSPCPTFLAGRLRTSSNRHKQARPYWHTLKYVNVWGWYLLRTLALLGLRRSNESLARHQLLTTRYCRFPLPPRSCTSPITRNFNNYCLTSHKDGALSEAWAVAVRSLRRECAVLRDRGGFATKRGTAPRES